LERLGGVAAEFDTLRDVVRIESEVDAVDDEMVNSRRNFEFEMLTDRAR
jgi:hypothetical protein